MSILKLVYIISLIMLGVMLVFTVFKPMTSAEEFSLVARESIIHGEDQWVIQFDIINLEGKGETYAINIWADDYAYSQAVLVRDKATFTYMHHIYPKMVRETGKVNLTIHKKGEVEAFAERTYYCRFD